MNVSGASLASLWAVSPQSQTVSHAAVNALNKVAINPQPLPPKGDPDMVTKAGIIIIGGKQLGLDDDCGNGQWPGPPLPRPDWPFHTALPNQQLLRSAVQFS